MDKTFGSNFRWIMIAQEVNLCRDSEVYEKEENRESDHTTDIVCRIIRWKRQIVCLKSHKTSVFNNNNNDKHKIFM